MRALAEADAVPHGLVAGFYPSLHVNLAEDYRKLGEPEQAREHLVAATEVAHLLPDGGYGDLIRTAIDRLSAELAAR